MEKDFPRLRLDLGHGGDVESFSFEEEFELEGGEGERIPCRAAVTAVATRTGSKYLLEGRIDATLKGRCSRCLKSFEMKTVAEFSLVLQRGGGIPEDVEEEDLVLLTEAEEYDYDIFPRVREAILLELPMKYLCSDSCAGICPGCGADLNRESCSCEEKRGDARWGALRKLLKQDKE